MSEPQNILAIVYDFDHTLSPHYMQDHTILRHTGIHPSEFWSSCTKLIKERGYDQELAYMKRMLDYDGIRKLSNADLQAMGPDLTFFPGVPLPVSGGFGGGIRPDKFEELEKLNWT